MTLAKETKPIKAFISYSWSTPEHEKWVLDLAELLCSDGIDIQMDKWELKEGHDKYQFMEKMVKDPDIKKVIIISDKIYAEKADNRDGGVGAETQIITPEIYSQTEQNKFVVVIRQKKENGEGYVPAYYKSRIYIDLADDDSYNKNYDQLLRWLYDKPVYQKPIIGKPPAHLFEDNSISIGTTTSYKRCASAIRDGKASASGCFHEYCKIIIENLERFRIKSSDISKDQHLDDIFYKNINSLLPVRNEILDLFSLILTYSPTQDFIDKIHAFFEQLYVYNYPTKNENSDRMYYVENYQEFNYQLFIFITALFIRHELFKQLDLFLSRSYFINRWNVKEYRSFNIFNENETTLLNTRNKRLQLKKPSLRATYLHDDWKSNSIKHEEIIQAEIILYLYRKINFSEDTWIDWTPWNMVYHSSLTPLDIFIKAQSKKFLDKLECLLPLESLKRLSSEKIHIPQHWPFSIFDLIGKNNLGMKK